MKRIKGILIAITIAIFILAVVSCNSTLKVSTDKLNLCVGDFVDVAEYVNGDFNMLVSDSNTAMVISESVLYAKKSGMITATISRGTQKRNININIDYAPVNLVASCTSPLYTTILDTTMEFFAELGNYADQDEIINWYVDGKSAGTGKSFSLKTSSYGKYEVTARAAEQECTLIAVCYKPFSSYPVISSDCADEVELYKEITFTVEYDEEANDFMPEIEWLVNGEVVQIGNKEFALTPTQTDIFTICAVINGVKSNEITFEAHGKIEPSNLRIDFDSDYPNVYLRWDGDPDCNITVNKTTYSADSSIGQNVFDLTDIIDLKKSSVVSLSSGTVVKTINTPVFDDRQISFLSKKYFNGNYYMISDAEVYDLISYAVMFRPDAVNGANDSQKVAVSLYMGYDYTMSAAMLLSRGWALTEQTGSYSMRATDEGSNVFVFEIEFFSAYEPTDFDTSQKITYNSLVSPDFSGGSEALPIEDRSGAQVTTSDQLYYVAQKGYRPVPQKGSAAERIYEKAKAVLNEIISTEMSDAQKVRAIFDWVMWQTTYDYEVVSIKNVLLAVKQPAYYLEGVFETGFAVCDGIAKAVSLLCNMEGLPCVRVVGIADNGTPDNHAWNKVKIDGAWYIVDATWSDARITVGGNVYEGGLHEYFLKADCEMPTHKPTYPELYPSATTFYDWYGTYAEKPMHIYDASADELLNAVKYGAENVTFTIGDEERDYYCIEIKLSIKAKNYFKRDLNEVNLILSAVLNYKKIQWSIVSNMLLVVVYKQ